MTYVWQRWLVSALEAEGCKVVVVDGWKNRGRYRSDGRHDLPPNWSFDPRLGFVWHHTGSTTSKSNPWPTGQTLVQGRSDLPGPLCNVSPDYNGLVHVVAAGRANHAGVTSGFAHTVKGADGNRDTVGCEIDYNGTQAMPVAQYRAAIRCAAAYCRHYGLDASYAYSHHETSVTGKWDPGLNGHAQDVDPWRRDLDECLSYPAGVWKSSSGSSSWGEVYVDKLNEGQKGSDSVKRLQYRLKHVNRIPAKTRSAVHINGTYDAATVAAVEFWQQNIYNPKTKFNFKGHHVDNTQAHELFGRRYRVIEK